MDDETERLISALRHKLAELNAEVIAYRHGRANEFRRYAADLLRSVPENTVAEVARVIDNEAMLRETYAALYAGFQDNTGETGSILAPPSPAHVQPRRMASPPPVLNHTSGVPHAPPLSPAGAATQNASHAREDDFRGVFTPPFLPLLDGSSYDHRPNGIRVGGSAVSDEAHDRGETGSGGAVAKTSSPPAGSVTIPPTPTAPGPAPAKPKLKSALRRSSSLSPAQSAARPEVPRRVRFSFDGKEVLPNTTFFFKDSSDDLSWLLHDDRSGLTTARPATAAMTDDGGGGGGGSLLMSSSRSAQRSQLLPGAAHDTQPQSHGHGARQGWDNEGLLDEAMDSGFSHRSSFNEPTRGHGSTSEQDEEFDTLPLARKVSSSERLRALSKMPLEDPSNWTLVNPQSSPSETGAGAPAEKLDHAAQTAVEGQRNEDEEDDDEDGEFIAMRPARTAPYHELLQSTTPPPPPTPHDSITAPDGDIGTTAGGDEDNAIGYPLTRTSDNTPYLNEEDFAELEREPGYRRIENETNGDDIGDTDNDDDDPGVGHEIVKDEELLQQEKSALGIDPDPLDSDAKLAFNHHGPFSVGTPSRARPTPVPSSPSASSLSRRDTAPPLAASVGSYRGQPLSLFNVVKDPHILQQAAELGNFDSFVGSVYDSEHYTTGYRNSFSNFSGRDRVDRPFSGTPRSLTERMMMDDAAARRSPARQRR
ncbi:hypothetical protein SPI_09031 [Niveomyces insectorum RCEF 264]|uniref:Uncharacterized protein n=1 Tax=Niveomyces insectorum RCEF 264 TaxID=1081102 RepID=A0A167M9G1_9HYPO|nr:hypothetical protein SPI_09031 [Niveomyces insectorum RCEF 264]